MKYISYIRKYGRILPQLESPHYALIGVYFDKVAVLKDMCCVLGSDDARFPRFSSDNRCMRGNPPSSVTNAAAFFIPIM